MSPPRAGSGQTSRRRAAAKRLRTHLWYPQVVIALLVAPLGAFLLTTAVETLLGVGIGSATIQHLEQRTDRLTQRPMLELALGVSLLAISIGVAFRSRLAWLWCVGLMLVGLALRVPPEVVDVPLAIYFAFVLMLLIFYRRHFATRSLVTSTFFAIVLLSTFFTWAILGTLRLGAQFAPPVTDLTTAMYFTIVTMSSVGYGDIVARGEDARLFTVALISVGLVVGATALSAILLPLIGGRMREILGGKHHMDRTDHYVIIGKSPLARNAALQLEKRGQRVTHILMATLEDEFFQERDVVVGDPTDLSVLRAAGAADAKGVLALSADDATNGFVVLGVNELDPTIATVTVLNDPANEFRLKRTQPSMMLSLQALGSELLAMALTGERVDVEMLTNVLQIHGAERSGAE